MKETDLKYALGDGHPDSGEMTPANVDLEEIRHQRLATAQEAIRLGPQCWARPPQSTFERTAKLFLEG